MEQSSTSAAVDPDRLTIQYFEQGGAKPQVEDIVFVNTETSSFADDKRCATFAIKNEDHTLGNALRHIIMQNPDVDFCGYSIPHPSEAKIHLRIQTRGPPAIEVLKKGLRDLKEHFLLIKSKFEEAEARNDYEHLPNVFV